MDSVNEKPLKDISTSRFLQEYSSKVVKAGKRTYFFDAKCTRNDEFYLTITESVKSFNKESKVCFEKHKIFLYQEDFEKFYESLKEIMEYIREEQAKLQPQKPDPSGIFA